VSDAQLQISLPQRFDCTVALDQSPAEGFLHVNVTTRFGSRKDHLVVLVNPSRTDGNDVQSLFRKHLAKVRIDFFGVRPFLGYCPPGIMLVCKSNNVHVGEFRKRDIDSVSVVSLACAANDAHPNAPAASGLRGAAQPRRQNSSSDGNGTCLQKGASGSGRHGN
jgi:hypothetical protein